MSEGGVSTKVFRYDTGSPTVITGTPQLEVTLNDPGFNNPGWFVFGADGTLGIVNRGDPLSGFPGNGSISIFQEAQGVPVSVGVFTSNLFNGPQGAAFRGSNEVFVVQKQGANLLRFDTSSGTPVGTTVASLIT